MNPRYVCVLFVLLLVECLHARSLIAPEEDSTITQEDQAKETTVSRVKRAPFGKLALLGGAALLGKKALLLGGAAVGAKVLVGAGLLGAGLVKAKHFGGGYKGVYASGYTHYDHEPSVYVEESAWY